MVGCRLGGQLSKQISRHRVLLPTRYLGFSESARIRKSERRTSVRDSFETSFPRCYDGDERGIVVIWGNSFCLRRLPSSVYLSTIASMHAASADVAKRTGMAGRRT